MSDEAMDVDGGGDSGTQNGGFEWAVPHDELDFYDAAGDNYGGKDSVIFAIDFSRAMFQQCQPKKEGADGQSALQTTLQSVREALISRIYRNEQDFLAIVLYNTVKAHGTNFKHIYVFDELQRPGAEIVKKLDKMIQMEEEELQAEFGSSDSSSIGELLWASNAMFSKITQKLFSKRILIFTVNDDPHRGNKQAINFAKQKATDISDNGIALTVFALDLPGIRFDQSKFWDDIIVGSDEDDNRVAPLGDWEDLTTAIQRKDHARRAMANLTLTLGEGLDLSVSVFTLVRTATKAPSVKLYSKTNEQVTVERTSMDEETATVLMPTDIKKYMTFAGRNIYFLPEEIAEMKHFGTVGLKLISFKALNCLKAKHHIRPAQFLYPNEADIRGSSKLFVALLKKCIDKNVMAVCQYIPRENIAPKFVGLVPQAEELGDEGQQLTPPGFHVIFFPYADDFRTNNPKHKDAHMADKEMIEKGRELIKKLKFKYNPEDFDNPALRTHLRNIEMLALDEEVKYDLEGQRITGVKDYTEPEVSGMERKAGRLIKEFQELVYPAGYNPLSGTVKKRAYDSEGAATKRGPAAAKTTGPRGTSAVDIAQAAEDGNLKKYTVLVLKEYCKNNKVKVDGTKKDDYIGAIETHLAGN